MRLSYTQFKTAFGLSKLSITDYVNVVYNEASKIEEVGCYVVNKNDVVYTEPTSSGDGKVYKIPIPTDMKVVNYNRGNSSIYTQNFKTLSNQEAWALVKPFNIYQVYTSATTTYDIRFSLPVSWSLDEVKKYVDGIKIFYKKAYLELDWIEVQNGKYYKKDTGTIEETATAGAAAKKADISKYVGKKIEFQKTTASSSAGNVFFTSNNTYISGVYYTGNYQEVTIPSNAKYFGYSYYTDTTMIARIKV